MKEDGMGEEQAAQADAPQEITCSGGVRLPLLNAPRERPQAEGEDVNEQ
jgi:hypothetical protein